MYACVWMHRHTQHTLQTYCTCNLTESCMCFRAGQMHSRPPTTWLWPKLRSPGDLFTPCFIMGPRGQAAAQTQESGPSFLDLFWGTLILHLSLPQGFAHTPPFSGNSLYPTARVVAAEVLRWMYFEGRADRIWWWTEGEVWERGIVRVDA